MKAEDFKFFTSLGVDEAADVCVLDVIIGALIVSYECRASSILCSPTEDWVGFKTADGEIHVVRPQQVAHLVFRKPT